MFFVSHPPSCASKSRNYERFSGITRTLLTSMLGKQHGFHVAPNPKNLVVSVTISNLDMFFGLVWFGLVWFGLVWFGFCIRICFCFHFCFCFRFVLFVCFYSGVFGAFHAHVWSRLWDPETNHGGRCPCSCGTVPRWVPSLWNVSPLGNSLCTLVCRDMDCQETTKVLQELCTLLLGHKWKLPGDSGQWTECDLCECGQWRKGIRNVCCWLLESWKVICERYAFL